MNGILLKRYIRGSRAPWVRVRESGEIMPHTYIALYCKYVCVPVLKGKGVDETADITDLSIVYTKAGPLRSLRFQTLSCPTTTMSSHVAYHQSHDLYVPSLNSINVNCITL